MKKKNVLPIFSFFIFLISSCTLAPSVPVGTKQYLLISSRPEPEPEWVTIGSHENTKSLLYFVGISGELHAEERDALKQARIDASNKFVDYCGVEAKVFSEFIQTVHGLSSQIQDATVAGTSGSTQQSEAYFSRLKLSQRYIEKYERNPGEYAYKIKVLVNVPKDEYDKVQAWKQQRSAERMLNTNNAIEGLFNSGRDLLKEGNVLGALNHFMQAKTIASESNLATATLHLAKIEKAEKSLTGHLQLKILENKRQTVEVDKIPEQMVAVLLWQAGEGEGEHKPVSDFPLKVEWSIFGENGSIKKSTDIEGKLTLHLPSTTEKGVILARVALDKVLLASQVSASALRDLEVKEVHFRIEVQSTLWQKVLGMLGVGSSTNGGASETTDEKPLVSDFAFRLGTADALTNYRLGDEVTLYSECAARCYVRLYHLGPDEKITVLADTTRKQLKNKREVLFRGRVSSVGKHIFLGTSVTGKFANRFKPGSEIYVADLMAQIKIFQLTDTKKAVFHTTLNVTE
jgi:hypothetical protein